MPKRNERSSERRATIALEFHLNCVFYSCQVKWHALRKGGYGVSAHSLACSKEFVDI